MNYSTFFRAPETGEGVASAEVASEVNTPEAQTAEFAWDDNTLGLLPENLRPHVSSLLERDRQYADITGKLGDRNLDDLMESHNTFSDYMAYMQEKNIAPEEMDTLLGIMGALSSGDAAAVEAMQDFFEEIQVSRGLKLPKDLEAQVKAKAITPEMAAELHTLRLNNGKSEAAQKREAQQQLEGQKETVATWVSSALKSANRELTPEAIEILAADYLTPKLEAKGYKVTEAEVGQMVEKYLNAFPAAQKVEQKPEQKNDYSSYFESQEFKSLPPYTQEQFKRIYGVN